MISITIPAQIQADFGVSGTNGLLVPDFGPGQRGETHNS